MATLQKQNAANIPIPGQVAQARRGAADAGEEEEWEEGEWGFGQWGRGEQEQDYHMEQELGHHSTFLPYFFKTFEEENYFSI